MKTIAAAALAALSTAASAATFDASGTVHGQAEAKMSQVGKALVVVNSTNQFKSFDATDPKSPMAGIIGTCSGTILIDLGNPAGSGYCDLTDKFGNHLVIRWTVETTTADGHNRGHWLLIGGTGKWDGASGGGTFEDVTDAKGAYTNKITGAVTLP